MTNDWNKLSESQEFAAKSMAAAMIKEVGDFVEMQESSAKSMGQVKQYDKFEPVKVDDNAKEVVGVGVDNTALWISLANATLFNGIIN